MDTNTMNTSTALKNLNLTVTSVPPNLVVYKAPTGSHLILTSLMSSSLTYHVVKIVRVTDDVYVVHCENGDTVAFNETEDGDYVEECMLLIPFENDLAIIAP